MIMGDTINDSEYVFDTPNQPSSPRRLTPTMTQELKTVVDVLEASERRLGTINEATVKLHSLMKSVRATGKKGTLTIKIEVGCDKNDELALTMSADVKSSEPAPERRKALIYHDSEKSTFSKTDPRQLELLAEQEAERAEREAALKAAGVTALNQIGRGETAVATA